VGTNERFVRAGPFVRGPARRRLFGWRFFGVPLVVCSTGTAAPADSTGQKKRDEIRLAHEWAEAAFAKLKELRPLFQGDIYPLAPLTTSQSDWYAYQLDRPDLAEGCAFFFRRPENRDASGQFDLEKIDPNAAYQVTLTGETYDQPEARQMSGGELSYLTIQIPTAPGSALLRYKQVRARGQ